MFWLSAAVCAALPSVSENASTSASTAINNAILLFSGPPCSGAVTSS